MTACFDQSSTSTGTFVTSAAPPLSTGSKVPDRMRARRGSLFQPTSRRTESWSAGRLPTSLPSCSSRSIRSQFNPASSRAARPAATSAVRTEAPKRTVSKPSDLTSLARTSTRGCGSGASSAGSSATRTRAAPYLPTCSARPSTPEPQRTAATSSPSFAAFERTPSEPLTLAPGRRLAYRVDLRARAGLADLLGAKSEVGGRDRVLRLLLRAHDPLERGVAGLVDRVGDGHDTGKRGLDDVVAVFGLALDLRLAVRQLEARGLGDDREAQTIGDSRPEHGAVGIGRLLPEDDEIRAFALDGLCERAARRDEVGAHERVVRDVHGSVCADRQGLAQRVGGLRRAHQEGDDLPVPFLLADAQSFLERVGVEIVQRPRNAAIEPKGVRIHSLRRRRVGHFLHANHYFHGAFTRAILSTQGSRSSCRRLCYGSALRARTGAS